MSGQLGHGARPEYSAVPVTVSGIDDARAVAAGMSHACAERGDGSVWCWGTNDFGNLGDGTTTTRSAPVMLAGLVTGSRIARELAGSVTCAVRPDGGVACVGRNAEGELGDGSGTDSSVPASVAGLTGVVALGGGGQSWCAGRSNGEAWCWGDNAYGQLGDGSTTDRWTPVRVVDVP
jgi:alpha-tubulin suppressor-like RCC1 family protein